MLEYSGNHYAHKHMNEQGYVFTCCGESHTFVSRKGRDHALDEHNKQYAISQANKKSARKPENRG